MLSLKKLPHWPIAALVGGVLLLSGCEAFEGHHHDRDDYRDRPAGYRVENDRWDHRDRDRDYRDRDYRDHDRDHDWDRH
jgi:hypothetical protein